MDSTNDMTSRTVEGTLAFCDWLTEKGYATTTQVDPWKTAIKKVFGVVDGENALLIDWSSLDLDEYVNRFQTLAGRDYKAESIVTYGRRMRNAFEAHEHYLTTGRAPTFRQGGKRQKAAEKAEKPENVVPIDRKPNPAASPKEPDAGMVDFPYPLGDGRMITLRLPPRMKADDVNRVTAFIRTLQDSSPEQRSLPRGENQQEEAA